MSGFKVIAIRALKNCELSISKVLELGKIYKFYNDYNFTLKDHNNIFSDVIECKYKATSPEDLYNIDKLNVNISAVVGKNGSGKSSLMDLFYSFCFAISLSDNKIEGLKPKEEIKSKSELEKIKLDNLLKYGRINCEVYYHIGNDICRVKLIDGDYVHEKLSNKIWADEPFNYAGFFYSIAINYSIYGLNSNEHNWVDFLFHKNDGYQIPVVINPYRTEGNIDINSELHLSQTRILLNLSSQIEKNPIIVNNKQIDGIEFTLNPSENDNIKVSNIVNYTCSSIFRAHEKKHLESIFHLFNRISKPIAGFELSAAEINEFEEIYLDDITTKTSEKYYIRSVETNPILEPTSIRIKYEFVKYVIRKLFKICIYYPSDYGFGLDTKKEKFITKPILQDDIELLINKIESDKSHITLKLRQALYCIKEKCFEFNDKWKLEPYSKNDAQYCYKLYMSWAEVKDYILKAERNNQKILNERMQIVPGAFVKPTIKIKTNSNTSHPYIGLSSGEQQLANTLQTIAYHIYNIHSVHGTKSDKVKYKYINIILDEIELYFHPEFQRIFIKELLASISRLKLRKIEGINLLFSTHSPFILSDIPSSNILHLKDGQPTKNRRIQTFGANLHELLANDFFLDKGFMGEFANYKIMEILKLIKSTKTSISDKEFIELEKKIKNLANIIGEPLIKDSILSTFYNKFSSQSGNFLEDLIKRNQELETENNRLKNAEN